MARRTLNRKGMRADFDAAERRKKDQDEVEQEESTAADEDGEEKAPADEEVVGEDEEELEEQPKKVKPVKAKPRPRYRAKTERMKVVWGVFNNSNQRVATFDYPRRQEAESLAAKLSADKKAAHFVQPIKEPLEQKKDD